MNEIDRIEIRNEERLEDNHIILSSAGKGALLFAYAGAIAGLVGGCEGTANIINNLPPEFVADEIRREVMYVLEYQNEVQGVVREIYDRMLNAGFLAVIFSAVGMIAGKIIDIIGRVRSGYYFRNGTSPD